jgi:hypothetical protein
VITVGHHQLRFLEDQVDDMPEDEFEKTMVIEPSGKIEEEIVRAAQAADRAARSEKAAVSGGKGRSNFKPSATQNLDDEKAKAVSLPLAKLQVLSGTFAGRELELTKALTTLGRPGIQVAAISRRADGYFIVHVESGKDDDYPLVNGSSIGPQARSLKDNDVIQLAGVKMGFFVS